MRLADLIELMDTWYDPRWAEPSDAVGLTCGDPQREVRRILFAVDIVGSVVDEAIEHAADVVVTHHPLLLTPVSSVAATTAKGRVVHRLVRNDIALFTAHTNADVPADGVNDALARTLGLEEVRALRPSDDGGADKLVVFVPGDAAEEVRRAVTAAGAGAIGDLEVVDEVRVEAVYPRALRARIVEALRAAHPYEEPAFDLIELAEVPGGPVTGPPPAAPRGHGRVGLLPDDVPLEEFAERVASALPATAHGVRVAGNPALPVRTVAVGAGSGDSLLPDVRGAGVDVYVTSDLKHHRAGEHLEDGGPALVDVAHWAAEWTWLPVVEEKVRRAAAEAGDTVETRVSATVTDPWTFRL